MQIKIYANKNYNHKHHYMQQQKGGTFQMWVEEGYRIIKQHLLSKCTRLMSNQQAQIEGVANI